MAGALSGPLGAGLARLTALAWEGRRKLYEAGILRPERVGARVVSIGNLSVGGAGKTTLVLHLRPWRTREVSASPWSRAATDRVRAGAGMKN